MNVRLGHGRPWPEIREKMLSFKERDFAWKRGRLPSYIYYRDEELLNVQREAYGLYLVENGLGKEKAFPSLLKMERDVIGIALDLLGGDEKGDAVFTSGGTESLVLAVKSARDWARAQGRFKEPFRIIAPETAHPAFNRAGGMMDIEVVRLPVNDKTFHPDLDAIRAEIDPHTIMLIGSAPQYPNGVFDPIPALGALATEKGLWLHVDSCVGGFLAPFARMIGKKIPEFDLSVPGVCSMSADIHKYGMAAKGASLLLFKDGENKKYAGFSLDWIKGTYATDGMQGTRAGGAIACAWAMMNYFGVDGYKANATKIFDTVEAMTSGIDKIAGLRVIRPFDLCLFAFGSEDAEVDINAVAEAMERRGWYVGRSTFPVYSIQIAINPAHAPIVDEYLADLSSSVDEVRAGRLTAEFDMRTY